MFVGLDSSLLHQIGNMIGIFPHLPHLMARVITPLNYYTMIFVRVNKTAVRTGNPVIGSAPGAQRRKMVRNRCVRQTRGFCLPRGRRARSRPDPHFPSTARPVSGKRIQKTAACAFPEMLLRLLPHPDWQSRWKSTPPPGCTRCRYRNSARCQWPA